MKYKVNQLVWFVDAELNITQQLVIKAALNRDARPVYDIVNVELVTRSPNGRPVAVKIAEDFIIKSINEADLHESRQSALSYRQEIKEMMHDIDSLVNRSAP